MSQYLPVHFYERILRIAKRRSPRDYLLFLLIGNLGLRVQECISIKAQDVKVSQDPGYIRIHTLKRRRPKMDLIILKDPLTKYLRSYLKKFPSPAYLFQGRTGPISKRAAQYIFKRYLKRARIDQDLFSIHSLRHMKGMLLYKETKDIRHVQKQLRHSSATTAEIYSHLDPETAYFYKKKERIFT